MKSAAPALHTICMDQEPVGKSEAAPKPRKSANRSRRLGLTPIQKRTVEGIAAGKPQTQAGKDAGYAPSTAAARSSQLMKRDDAQAYLRKCLKKSNIDETRLAKELDRALEACAPQDGEHIEYFREAKELLGYGPGKGNHGQPHSTPFQLLQQFNGVLNDPRKDDREC